MRVQVKLRIELALRRQRRIELLQAPPLALARLHLVFGSCGPIDHSDRYTGMADAIAQLRGEIPLDLLATEVLDSGQNAPDQDLGAHLRQKRGPLRDPIT